MRTEEIVFDSTGDPTSAAYRAVYERTNGNEGRLLRAQYLAIEEELERAYRYVAPCDANAGTFSFKFADTIRSAAGAVEVLSRLLYGRFFTHDPDRQSLDIYNYLSLDSQLDLSTRRVINRHGIDQFPTHPEVTRPFVALAGWDRASPVREAHVPGWWRAYRDVKHDLDGLQGAATLANATAAVAALFVLVGVVYGFGILTGGMFPLPHDLGGDKGYLTNEPQWARLLKWYESFGRDREA